MSVSESGVLGNAVFVAAEVAVGPLIKSMAMVVEGGWFKEAKEQTVGEKGGERERFCG